MKRSGPCRARREPLTPEFREAAEILGAILAAGVGVRLDGEHVRFEVPEAADAGVGVSVETLLGRDQLVRRVLAKPSLVERVRTEHEIARAAAASRPNKKKSARTHAQKERIMNDNRTPTIGGDADRPTEDALRRDVADLDRALGGERPTELDYRPGGTGAVDVNALRDVISTPPPIPSGEPGAGR